jgi:type III secretion protein U
VARPSENATEEPTPRRLAEARRRGEVAVSRELSGAAALLAVVAVLVAEGPALAARAVATLRASLAAAVAGASDPSAFALSGALALRLLGPPLAVVVLVLVAMGLAQTRGLVLAPVRVDLGRVGSPEAWHRLFDGRAARAIGAGLFKVVLVGAVAALALRPFIGALVALTGAPTARLLAAWSGLSARLVGRLAVVGLALGAADALLVANRHRRGLRMTRDEVKREHRESEGDPAHRGERQRLHREILERRMIEEVRRADFVVVSPEPLAVALRYDASGDAAPVVVAKGERLVAERIKLLAREAGVPVFHDVGLARALGELGEGREIAAGLYEPVAEILRVLQDLGTRSPAPRHASANVAPNGSASRIPSPRRPHG